MDIIYDVPGTFRITLVRDYTPHLGSSRLIRRETPFVLHLRVPGVAAVENVELTDELFSLLLRLPAEDALAVQKHLHPKFNMSPAMLAQITAAPKSLLSHVIPECSSLGT